MTLLAMATTDRGLCDPATAVVRADDEALLRGRAAFETLRVYGGRPFRLDEHLDRLVGSAASIGLPPLARADLERLAGLVLPGQQPANRIRGQDARGVVRQQLGMGKLLGRAGASRVGRAGASGAFTARRSTPGSSAFPRGTATG